MASVRIAAFLAAILCVGLVQADESKRVEIRLNDIWASHMPGTRDIRELEPEFFKKNSIRAQSDSLINQIGESLSNYQQPGNGFCVTGTDLDALKGTHLVLALGKPPKTSFDSHDEITAVFYSLPFDCYVEIDPVKRSGTTIEISYRLVPHDSKELTSHFALIPLGQLPPGKYDVQVHQVPMDQKYIDEGYKPVKEKWTGLKICTPFTFTVKDK